MLIEMNIYSPRWGHDDVYRVEFDQDFMEMTMQARKTRATWVEDRDPEWKGEPLKRIMQNDSISPPANIQDLFVYAWMAWRNGELSSQDADTELQLIAEWLNTITKAKPQSDFWSKYF